MTLTYTHAQLDQRKTTKMAGSIASELLSTINRIRYKVIILALLSNVGISETLFPKTQLATKYKLDIHRWVDGSYMNPNALFEYFGLFSSEDGKTVRKNMLKYLGLHKKNSWKNCNTLKNSWIALHMKGLTAQEWLDSMKKFDTAGDEIALYVLCRMYNRHCMVYTKMNIWSTVDTDVPIPEETLIGMCDICLLFIETDVFGELQIIPYAPAPGKQLFGDARIGLPPAPPPDGNNNSVSPPLNLSVVAPTVSTSFGTKMPAYDNHIAVKGDNAIVDNGNVPDKSPVNSEGPLNQPQTGLKSKPNINRSHATSQGEPGPHRLKIGELDFSLVRLSSSVDVKTLNCTVNLTKLTEQDIDKWQNKCVNVNMTHTKDCDENSVTQVGGHNLRIRQKYTGRLDRNAKHNVCYLSTTEQSSDEGYNSPRKKQKHHKPLPLSGPSADRLRAQDLISKKHTSSEHEAAKALVTLSTDVRDSSALSSENDTDTDTSTGKSVPTGTTSTDSVVSGTPSSSMSSSEDTDHVSGSESDIPHSRTASSDGSVSSGTVNKNRDVSTDGEISESDLPLAKLKDKLKKEEVNPPCKKQTMVFKTSKIICIKRKY